MPKVIEYINGPNSVFKRRKVPAYSLFEAPLRDVLTNRLFTKSKGLYILTDENLKETWYVGYALNEKAYIRITKHVKRATGEWENSKCSGWDICQKWIRTNNYDFLNFCKVFVIQIETDDKRLLKQLEFRTIADLNPLANIETCDEDRMANLVK